MKKILDILLIAILTILLFNLLTGEDNKELNNTLNISFIESNYSIPASVGVEVNNQTSTGVLLNTCDDINISYSGEKLSFGEGFCKDIEVKSGENYVIKYDNYYKKFDNTGNYTLTSNISDKEYFDQFELENSGTFKKIFTTILYAPIYNLVVYFINLFQGSFGLAIVCVTIILRVLLLWPQHKMMVSQRKLQAIQPKIKKIQEEFKGNQQMLGMKMMELYKKEKVNPVGSCGFLLIQMPILLVIYYIIIGIQDPSNIYYLYSFQELFTLGDISFNFYGLDLLKNGGIQGLILGIIVASIQFLQIKLSLANKSNDDKKSGVVLEKKSGDDKYSQMMPDPEMINKFMLYGMPVMVGIFTFSLFAAVGVYWGIGTLFMLFQQLVVNKIIQK